MNFSDEQMISDILTDQKALAKLYMDGILESSCPKMRSTLGSVHSKVANDAYACFNYMTENNMYAVDYADTKKLQSVIAKFS